MGGFVLHLVQKATPHHFAPTILVLHCPWKSELRCLTPYGAAYVLKLTLDTQCLLHHYLQ